MTCKLQQVKVDIKMTDNLEVSKVLNSDMPFSEKLDKVLDILHGI